MIRDLDRQPVRCTECDTYVVSAAHHRTEEPSDILRKGEAFACDCSWFEQQNDTPPEHWTFVDPDGDD